MGSTTADTIDEGHNFVRNKTLEIDAGGRLYSKAEYDPKKSKTGARKARRVVSNQKGSKDKDDLPVPREIQLDFPSYICILYSPPPKKNIYILFQCYMYVYFTSKKYKRFGFKIRNYFMKLHIRQSRKFH